MRAMVICSTWDLGSGTLPTRMSRAVSMRRLVSVSSMGHGSTYQLVDEAVEGGNGTRVVEVEAGSQLGLVNNGVVGNWHVAPQPLPGTTDGFGIFRRSKLVRKPGATERTRP